MKHQGPGPGARQPAFDWGALAQQALGLHRQGDLAAARSIYDQVLAAFPGHAVLLSLRGALASQLGEHSQAVGFFDQSIAISPGVADVHYNRGIALKQLGQAEEALASYDRAVALSPGHIDALYNRANGLRELERFEQALASYEQVLRLAPHHAQALANRGLALAGLKRTQAALASYDQALLLAPDLAEAWCNRGAALLELGRLDEALASSDKAMALQPGDGEILLNRGNLMQDLDRLAEALACYDGALTARPAHAPTLANRALVKEKLRRFEQAFADYDQAIVIDQDLAQPRFNKSLALLLTGDMEAGWPLYEWRFHTPKLTLDPRLPSQPLWLGDSPVEGRTLLLRCEQGLGDTLQFSRYASLLARRGARVILEVQPPLLGLMRRLQGVSEVVAPGDTLPPFDLYTPLLSLPLAFRTSLADIPASHAYLSSTPVRMQRWQERLGPRIRPRVGLVWSGSTTHVNDRSRSLALRTLVRYLPDGIDYLCLQKELRDGDQAVLQDHTRIRFVGDAIEDFEDTAALCDLVDLVVSVDTSVAHLAAALGRPTRILLPFHPDWRWLLYRDDSPWYPSVRLYRQPTLADWDGVLQRLAVELPRDLDAS